MAALYFQASNHTKISEWEKAAALLDSFLKAYPDPKKNIYMPFALFDRAQTHFTLEELEPALTLCNRIEKEFPGAAVMELNYNLKGNILELLDRESDSEKYHKKALQLAETKENKDVAGESLYYLVRLIGKERGKDKKANPRMLEALPFYDKFWAEHNNESAFQAKMAVVGLPAMKKAGREKEGLERMQGVISNITKAGGNSTELEEVINSYTEAYLESHTPEQLKEHYYNFPLIDSKDFATLAFLRISVINTYEKVVDKANKEGDDSAKSAAQAQVQVLFEDLRGAFNTDDLSPYILVRVGDFLREKTTAPIQAKPYYEAALKHQGHEYKFHALFGMADILAQGSEKGLAAEYLQRVIDSPDAKGQKEKALARMVDILFNQGNYTRAIESANAYLSNPKYRKNSLLVRLTLARARDANGQSEDAMAVFAQVWATATGTIRYSAPAIHRWMELTWERNGEDKSGKSDRQHAYEGGWRYVDQTKHIAVKLKKDGPQEELDLWNKVKELVLQYEASAETKTMKEILEEKGK